MRAWLAPTALGLAVALATIALGPRLVDTRPSAPEAWQAAAAAGIVWPFEPGPGGGSFLAVAPLGHGSLPASNTTGIVWWTAHVGVLNVTAAPAACPCVDLANGSLVRVTAYVFRAGGTLLATNDAGGRTARFQRDGYYAMLPNGTWAIGPQAAANGSQALPPQWAPILEVLRPELDGLGAGGVVAVAVAHHPHPELGTLYVTLRLDAVEPWGAAGAQAAQGPG